MTDLNRKTSLTPHLPRHPAFRTSRRNKADLSPTMGAAARLRLGSTAPNFKAETTQGPIDFHEFIGDKWVVLFSHPEDYTPVCTTELGAFAKLEPEFARRGVKLIGLSANTIDSHGGWIKDINEVSGSNLSFPIIGDKQRQVALLYDMLDRQDATNVDSKGIAFTIRSVFVIDPKKTIRLIMSYPASTGRNSAEVLRVIDSLQTGDKHKVTTPINWTPGTEHLLADTMVGMFELTYIVFPRRRRDRGAERQDRGRAEDLAGHEDRQALPALHAARQVQDQRGLSARPTVVTLG